MWMRVDTAWGKIYVNQTTGFWVLINETTGKTDWLGKEK